MLEILDDTIIPLHYDSCVCIYSLPHFTPQAAGNTTQRDSIILDLNAPSYRMKTAHGKKKTTANDVDNMTNKIIEVKEDGKHHRSPMNDGLQNNIYSNINKIFLAWE